MAEHSSTKLAKETLSRSHLIRVNFYWIALSRKSYTLWYVWYDKAVQRTGPCFLPKQHTLDISDMGKQIVSASLWLPRAAHSTTSPAVHWLLSALPLSRIVIHCLQPSLLILWSKCSLFSSPFLCTFRNRFPCPPFGSVLSLRYLHSTSSAWERCSLSFRCAARPPVCEPNDALVLPARGFCKLGRAIHFTSCLCSTLLSALLLGPAYHKSLLIVHMA